MPEKRPVSVPTRKAKTIRRWLKYMFLGGVVGLVVAVLALFVVAVLYGEAIGLSPAACTLFACSLTMLLSQPAGVAGMLVGATVGVVAGGVMHYVHHSPRAI